MRPNERYGGFYTQAQIKDIVKYAAERYITVIPEIEMPGHSSAAIAAYPQLSCFPSENTNTEKIPWAGIKQGKQVQQTWGVFEDVYCPSDYTFHFLENVLDEVMQLFPSKYIHIGGDECPKDAWKKSTYCQKLIRDKNLKDEQGLQSYFIQKIEKYINSKGHKIIGWDEILEGGLAPNSTVMSTQEISAIKGLIRRCEAKATCKFVGLSESQIHFLNLPFYETGTIEKNPMSDVDVKITIDLLEEIQPHQIYCAGDFADPHGTHKVCFDVVIEALKQIKSGEASWLNDCWLWLYKGAWQEWDITEIEMAIPMSPDQVVKKRNGIFIHQSQKDSVPYLGSDNREFWQRAEERNANTAKLYAQLGLTHYAAMEAFKRWKF